MSTRADNGVACASVGLFTLSFRLGPKAERRNLSVTFGRCISPHLRLAVGRVLLIDFSTTLEMTEWGVVDVPALVFPLASNQMGSHFPIFISISERYELI